nr:serine--tRNA ligase [Chloroflexota bacterium]
MNPLQLIREQPSAVRAILELRHFDAPLDRIVELDTRSRTLRAEVEQLRAERNKGSKGGPPSEAVKIRMREVGERIKAIEAEL